MSHSKTRTIITGLEFENFKSYAGKQQIGPFHKSFSSIVGPNGSGKSNVIDGLLFVFGWNAKKIRQSKVSDLIHSSPAHPSLEHASVAVHFVDIVDHSGDADDNYEEVEGTQLTVSRTAYKDNTSKYFMAGRAVLKKEVVEELLRRGIDLDHNRFLILQGEVESISMLKPKAPSPHEDGLLEYLEDIIGSNRYVEDINAAGAAVDEITEQFGEALNRVKATEKERAGLDGPRREAVEFASRENEKYKLESQVCQLDKLEAEQKLGKLQERQETATKDLEEVRSAKQEHEQELDALKSEFNAGKTELDQLQKAMEQSKSGFQEFERKDIKFREDLKHEKKALKSTNESLRKERKKHADQEAALEEATTAIPRLQKEVEDLSKKVEKKEAEVEEKLDGLTDKTAGLRAKLVKEQAALQPFVAKLSEEQSSKDMVEGEMQVLQKKQADTEAELQQALESADRARAEVAQHTERRAGLDGVLQKARSDKDAKKAELADTMSKESALAAEKRAVMDKVEAAKHNAKEAMGRGTLHSALMKAKGSKLPGLLGRLGDLCQIEAKYDVAVTTATPQLNSYVVKTTSDGEACVKYLRQHNLGVASFIILDKMERFHRQANAPFNQVEDAPRLYDLIQPTRPDIAGAVYFAVRGTLVAEDMNSANKLAFGAARRARVVTLSGQVIEPSGTMSGGGQRVRRGGMRILGGGSRVTADGEGEGGMMSAEEMQLKEKWLKGADVELRQLRDQRRALENAIRTLAERIEKVERDVKQADAQMATAQKIATECERVIPKLEKAAKGSKEHKDRLTKLERDLASCDAKLQKTQKSVDKAQAAVDKIQSEIDDVGGPEMKRLREVVAGLTVKFDDKRKELCKAEVQTNSVKKMMAKLDRSIPDKEKKVALHKERITDLEDRLKQLTEDAFEVQEAYETSQKLVEAKSSDLKSRKKAFDKKDKEMLSLRSKEVDLENEEKDIKHRTGEIKAAVQHSKKLLAAIRKKMKKNLSIMSIADDEEDEEVDPPVPKSADADGDAAMQEDTVAAEDDAEMGSGASEAVDSPPSAKTMDDAAAGLEDLTEDELEALDKGELVREIKLLQQALESMSPNYAAVDRWKKKDKEYRKRSVALEELGKKRDHRREVHDGLKAKRLQEFMDGFTIITMKLKEIYQMITLGGDAELEIVDSLDPFSEGIVFSVRPPKKSWKNISNLSGGEKTLSSLALVFALHHFNPTPLYVMDEIDAALDFKNVSIVAHFLKERTKNAQFVIISLRNHMFELADRLVGIYKTDNQTKSVTINPSKFVMDDQPAGAMTDATAVTV